MANGSRKVSRLTLAVAAVLALFLLSWIIAQLVDDRSVLGAVACNGVNGMPLPILAVLIGVFLVKKRWVSAAGSAFALLLYLVFTRQLVWNTQDSPPGMLRVMTFNIEHGRHGVERIADLVRGEGVDVFAFQECGTGTDASTIVELKRLLPEYQIYAEGSRTSGSRLPVLRQRAVPLDNLPYSWTAVEQIVRYRGQAVRILNVHSPSYIPEVTLKKPKGYWVRRWPEVAKEQTDLIEHELKVVADDQLPTLLCGDFNMSPVGRRYQQLRRYAVDSFIEAGRGFGWTSPAAFPMRRIDYVWAFPGCRPVDCRVVNWLASDHAAVVADVAVVQKR